MYKYFLVNLLFLVAASDCQQSTEKELDVARKEIKMTYPASDRKQYRDGDIILAAAMQVSNVDENGDCVEEITGMQLVESMNMIIDKVNDDDTILPGVKLGTLMIDTCSSEPHALQRVITDILPLALEKVNCGKNCTQKSKKKSILAGIVGASLSSVSLQLATVLQIFNIPQVSYWSTSSELSDKRRFKYFFRSVPPDAYQVDAMIAFIKQQGWNYISVIYDDDTYGVDGYSGLLRTTKMNDICIAITKSLPRNSEETNMIPVVEELLAIQNSRVVVVFTVGANAEKLLRAAQKIPKAMESLVWIGAEGWIGYIPRDHTDNSYLDAIDGTIGFATKYSAVKDLKSYMINLTLAENYNENLSRNPWFPEHISKRNNCSLPTGQNTSSSKRICDLNESIDPNTFRTYNVPVSDAVHSFIYALDAYHKDVCGGRSGLCDAIKSKAGTNELSKVMYHYLKNVTFTGVSGSVFKFDKNQDGPPIYDAFIFSKNNIINTSENLHDGWIKAGTYEDNFIKWDIELPEKIRSIASTCSKPCGPGEAQIQNPQKCCWYCRKCSKREFVYNGTSCKLCPRLETPNNFVNGCEPMSLRQMEYSSPHSIFALSFGVFGLLCTSYITFIFIKYRATPIVRASGKELCYFVLFGILLTLMNCFTVTAPPSKLSCVASRVVLTIGPSCMYVGLLMKTIRVVFIFQSKKIMTTKIRSYLQPAQFTIITIAVTAFQVVVLIIWFIVKDANPQVLVFDNSVSVTCKVLIDIEILIGLVYPFLIIIVCTILATVNRNVPTGFRETLFVGFSMYTTCVIWLAFLPIFLTNSTDILKKLTTVSTALTLSAITILFCLFAPRCYTILFRPELNTSETVMSRQRSYSTKNRQSSSVYPETQNNDSTRNENVCVEEVNRT